MNSKAIKRQLLAAIAMVLVAALALGSSTYAWFVGQNSVEANGLTIQAQAEAGILIAHHHTDNVANNVWASTASGSFTNAKSLLPTSTNNGSAWYHASAQTLSAKDATAGSMTTLTGISNISTTAAAAANVSGSVGTLNNKEYYILDQFDIYTTGTSASNLILENIVVANANNGIDPSLRLLVVCGSNKFVVAPVTGATVDYTVGVNADGITSTGTATHAFTTAEMTAGTATVSGSPTSTVLSATVSTTNTTPTEVQVYVYYEGEDDNHYSNNFNDHVLSVTLTFAATVVA